MTIAVAVCSAAYGILLAATAAGQPWAGSAAVAALAGMNLGIFYLLLNRRA